MDPALRKRMGGQSRTILFYPLRNDTEESDIEEFVKSAALSAPLRIDLFKFQSAKRDDFNAYAYVTFNSSADCWLIKKHLNRRTLNDAQVNITFSSVPRSDLEGMTTLIEFGTNYPPITSKKLIGAFLHSFDAEMADTMDVSLPLITSPVSIEPAPGHGRVKGKWFLTYESPEIATKALEFYSGRYLCEQQKLQQRQRFVILNYQINEGQYALDRKQCFFSITDRVILHGLSPRVDSKDTIVAFLESNGFNVSKDVSDVHIIHHQKKAKNGFVIVTFADYKLANRAYTNLNHKTMTINDDEAATAVECEIVTGFASPQMTDPLKQNLKNETNVIHLSNLPWDVDHEKVKQWLSTASPQHVRPVHVFLKFRDGFFIGRANATFAKNAEATVAVEALNGKKFGDRCIALNWALPIKNRKFKEQRMIALQCNTANSTTTHDNDNDSGSKLVDADRIHFEHDCEEDDDIEKSAAFRKIQKLQSKQQQQQPKQKKKPKQKQEIVQGVEVEPKDKETKNNKNESKSTAKKQSEKRGTKRKQQWSKSSKTKKIKLAL